MVTIPNQSSVPEAFKLFDEAGRPPAGPHYERLIDVCEELVRFTLLIRDNAEILVDRYSDALSGPARKRRRRRASPKPTPARQDKGVVVSALGITQALA